MVLSAGCRVLHAGRERGAKVRKFESSKVRKFERRTLPSSMTGAEVGSPSVVRT